MTSDRERIETAIAALSAQRGSMGDEVLDTVLAPLLAQLQAMTQATQSLRQVTILFLDMVGSTSISQHLDPEDIHALMDGALERCTAIVATHGGRVLQYAGDNLLACFGIGQAREDDAERAVQAGLALLEEGRRLGASVLAQHGHAGLDVRVGIHTGSVLLGGGVDADASIRGLAVNVAARLEQTAPPGTVRISRDTYRQVRQQFEVEAQPPLRVKGIDEPIASYLVRAARAPAEAAVGADTIDTPLVGREAELAELSRLLDEARTTRSSRLVTLAADAGVGKSRLLSELQRSIDGSAGVVRCFRSRARTHGQVLHGIARDLLAHYGGILDSDAPEAARAKLIASFGAPFGDRAGEQSALVGQLIGFDFSADPHIAGILQDGKQIRARAFHAIAQFLRLQAEEAGLVLLLIEDLHWADDASLDLIEHIVNAGDDVPLAIVCSTRPSLFERRPSWSEGRARQCRLMLEPLIGEAGGRLADALLGRLAGPAPELRALLVGNAEGNPFHMEELLAMLLDDGTVEATPEGWRIDRARLAEAGVPTTLTAVLQSRLDALPPKEHAALQRGSVIGHVFWDGALEVVAPGDSNALDALSGRALIAEHAASSFAATREYGFKHHLLHQVTYDTVLKKARRELHRLAAEWLVTVTGERVGEHVGLIAHHFERAGDAMRAADYLGRAARAAYNAAAYGDARAAVDRALALLPASDQRQRFDLLLQRADIHNVTGHRTEQAADIESAAQCAEQLGDDRLRARVGAWRALIALITGRYAEAIAESLRTEALAISVGDDQARFSCLLHRGQAMIFQHNEAGATTCLETVLALLGSGDDGESANRRIRALNQLESLARSRGDFGTARTLMNSAIDLARKVRNRRFEGGLLGNLGAHEAALGRLDESAALSQSALQIAREIGDRGSEPYPLHTQAIVACERGDFALGLALATEGRAIACAVADKGAEAICVMLQGCSHAALGASAEALASFDTCDTWAADGGIAPAARETAPHRAALALAQCRLDEAQAIVSDIEGWLEQRQQPARPSDARAWFVCHQVHAATGSPRARDLLGKARDAVMMQSAALQADHRTTFLENIRLHREIEAAWAAGGD